MDWLVGTEPRLGGIYMLSYPRLPPLARARWSRPQLQDRKGSGGEGGARRRGKGQKEGREEGGARRVEHNTGIHTHSPGEHSWAHVHCWAGKGEREGEVAQLCLTLATPWTAAYQAPPSMGFSRQKYWSGVPLPSPVPPGKPLKIEWKLKWSRSVDSLRPHGL